MHRNLIEGDPPEPVTLHHERPGLSTSLIRLYAGARSAPGQMRHSDRTFGLAW